MERRICPAEKHPLLIICNLVTLSIGLGLAFQAILFGTTEPGKGLDSSFLIGIVLVFLSTNTGKMTQNFRHWDYGLSFGEKLFASLSISVGALASGWVLINVLNSF